MGNTPEQDDELVRELYSRYRRPLHGYVLRAVGGDHQRAEDVVQETLLRAWRHAGTLDAEHAGPWLYTVARNLIISGYLFKVAIEAVFTPVTYRVVNWLKKVEHEDYYDIGTNFNPFLIGDVNSGTSQQSS